MNNLLNMMYCFALIFVLAVVYKYYLCFNAIYKDIKARKRAVRKHKMIKYRIENTENLFIPNQKKYNRAEIKADAIIRHEENEKWAKNQNSI